MFIFCLVRISVCVSVLVFGEVIVVLNVSCLCLFFVCNVRVIVSLVCVQC